MRNCLARLQARVHMGGRKWQRNCVGINPLGRYPAHACAATSIYKHDDKSSRTRVSLKPRHHLYRHTNTYIYIYIYNSNLCIAVTRARPIVEFVASSRMEKLERVGIFYFLQCFINRLLSPSLCLFLPITRALYILIKL